MNPHNIIKIRGLNKINELNETIEQLRKENEQLLTELKTKIDLSKNIKNKFVPNDYKIKDGIKYKAYKMYNYDKANNELYHLEGDIIYINKYQYELFKNFVRDYNDSFLNGFDVQDTKEAYTEYTGDKISVSMLINILSLFDIFERKINRISYKRDYFIYYRNYFDID